MTIGAQKQSLRREIQQRLAAIPADERSALGTSVLARLTELAQYRAAQTVLWYVGVRHELPTSPVLRQVLEGHQRVVVPYCVGDYLELFHLTSMDELTVGRFGILEPKADLRVRPERRVDPAELDLVVAPGVAFDRQGGRLGHGAGFFDRLLADVRPDCLLAAPILECQLVDHLPAEPHDVPMHLLVTERQVLQVSLPREPSDDLDLARLTAGTWIAGAEHHTTLPSTNDRARELAADPQVTIPQLIVADRQTAGRGRGANRWWTGDGSLAISLLFDPGSQAVAPQQCRLLALSAGVAVVDCLAPLLRNQRVGLHWPNDVYVRDRKLAGVLVEVLPSGRHIVGLGINTNNSLEHAPRELQRIATSLRELTGRHHPRQFLLRRLLGCLDRVFQHLARSPAEFGRRLDTLCLQHGRTLTLEQGRRQIVGRCQGIAPDGALLLETSDGLQRHYTGSLRKV